MLVVLTHLPGIELNHSPDQILPEVVKLGISGVDLFFVISGFIMVWVTRDMAVSGRKAVKFLYARFTRIYPLYWVLAFALFCVWQFDPSIINFDPTVTSLPKSFALLPVYPYPMLTVAWTLTHELYFYFIFSLTLLLPRQLRFPALTVWAVAVILGNLSGLGQKSLELAVIFNPMGLEFYMGALAAVIFIKFKGLMGRWVFRIGIALWLSMLVYQTQFSAALIPTDWTRIIMFGIPATLIVYGCVAIEQTGQTFSRWSQVLGDWSYSIYLSHILTLSALGFVWRWVARNGATDNIVVLSIMLALMIAVSGLIYHMIETPLLRLTKHIGKRLFKEKSANS